MKYIIRKVPERNTKYLERLLPDAEIVNDVKHNGCIWSFLKAIEVADGDAIYIQDDMLLCKDFKNKAEEYVKKYPNDVICFSTHIPRAKSLRDIYQCLDFTERFYEREEFGVCLLATYIPKQIADDFVQFMLTDECKELPRYKTWINMDADDCFFADYLETRKRQKFLTVPMLAGHELNKSVVYESRPLRFSPNFDYENGEQKRDDEV